MSTPEPLIDAPIREGRTESRDGTSIAYYEVGRGPIRWVMPPAMGAPLLSMKAILEGVQEQLTVVTWDMRGFQRSAAPEDPDAYGVDRHVDDLQAVCRAVGVERYLLGGWSMAVQVSLEHLRRVGQRDVLGLLFIQGPYEHVLDHVLPSPALAALSARALSAGKVLAPVLNPVSRRLLGRPGFPLWLQKVGLLR